MARCLRCGAGNEWIEGDQRKAPRDRNPNHALLDELEREIDEMYVDAEGEVWVNAVLDIIRAKREATNDSTQMA